MSLAAKYPWRNMPVISALTTILIGANLFLTVHWFQNSALVIYNAILLLPVLLLIIDNIKPWSSWEKSKWPGWIHLLSLTSLATGIAISGFTFEGLLQQASPIEKTHTFIQTAVLVTETVSAFLSVTLFLPKFCHLCSQALCNIPHLPGLVKNACSASGFYGFLFFGLATYAYSVLTMYDRLTTTTFLFSLPAVILAISYRSSLWKTDSALWARLLPHVPAWGLLIFTPINIHFEILNLYIDKITTSTLIVVAYCLSIAGAFYWSAQRLRSAPVKTILSPISHQADSIQSREAHYIDERNLSKRLQGSIQRSDGGVFGITGVRGAGKSALMRHVLYELSGNTKKEGYFTTEVTAPVRYDDDMGFFITVCRNVCRKVIDDLEPIILGKRKSAQSQLSTQFRNVAAVILCCVALGIFAVNVKYTGSGLNKLNLSIAPLNVSETYDDPLLGATPLAAALPLILERQSVDDLLSQIDKALASNSGTNSQINKNTNFLIIPNSPTQQFLLLRQRQSTDAAKALGFYRQQMTKPFANSYEFFFSYLDPLMDIGPTAWSNYLLTSILNYKINAPLLLVSNELRSFLLSNAPTTDTPLFLSQILVEAFLKADPNLSFDYTRLEQFAEAIRVYRQLLDGNIVTTTASNSFIASRNLNPLDPNAGIASTTFWITIALLVLLFVARPAWRNMDRLVRSAVNRRYFDAYMDAQSFMEQLAYRSSQESTAGFSFKGFSFGRKKTLEIRDFTIPGLTARYTQFLQKILPLYNGKLIIGIDELDKIHDPEQVKALLSEIKGALFMQGTYYLLSISEDAARSFRRRLASGRDIFESTFDDVVDIPQMDVQPAVEMLILREKTGEEEKRLPVFCLLIAALFGGGIPREIIRARRTLSYAMKTQEQATPTWAVYTLLEEELRQWEQHIGEANLSGTDTVKLRSIAHQARQQLHHAPDRVSTYGEIWNTLEPCIQIVDPEGLRNSVGYLADTASANDELASRYQQIAEDLQVVLRLMILTHLSELILSNIDYTQFDHRILDCHRALADKPALAEALMRELKDDQGIYKSPTMPNNLLRERSTQAGPENIAP